MACFPLIFTSCTLAQYC